MRFLPSKKLEKELFLLETKLVKILFLFMVFSLIDK